MFFNTTQSWQINGTTYDLMTVAIHEFGHALGMGHSTDTAAAMYASYTTTKQAVDSDDIAGVRSIYNARQQDAFEPNNQSSQAANITSYIDGNGQVSLPALDITTPAVPGQGDPDWFKLTVPATTSGTMVVKMQSTQLSLLTPTLAVFNSSGTTLLGQQSSTTMGDTVSVTLSHVSSGQVYLIRCTGTSTGDAGFGAYGLEVNLGSLTQPPISPPNTTVAQQPDHGGGTMNKPARPPHEHNGICHNGTTHPDATQIITVGSMTGLGDVMKARGWSNEASSFVRRAPWMPLWPAPRPGNAPGAAALQRSRSNQTEVSTGDHFSSSTKRRASLPTVSSSKNRESEWMHTNLSIARSTV
jgi:hypothetical protein